MEWSAHTELYQMSVIAAPYGGPMAIVRDTKDFVKVGGSTVKPVIKIFTASGHLLASINVRTKLQIFSFYFLQNEKNSNNYICSGIVEICYH